MEKEELTIQYRAGCCVMPDFEPHLAWAHLVIQSIILEAIKKESKPLRQEGGAR
jgi:hypothetical protein